MILEMRVPSPGESITEVEIATWLVEDGEYVEKDQPIAEVDSDKATLELPAEESGIITLQAEEGDAVEVGAVVCLIDTAAAKPEGSSTASEKATVKETPKVNPHIPEMQQIIADILQIETEDISIKATTHEKVDSFGEKRAIKAYAVALLYKL